MATPKKAPIVTPAPVLRCTICQVEVTPETYAAHIQSVHTTPLPTPPPASIETTADLAASIPPWNGGWTGPGAQGPQAITGPIFGKELAGGKYLKGEDVPDGTVEVRFRVLAFVRDPGGRSKLAAQISETYQKTMFGFNTTNIRTLVKLGFEDLQKIVNRTVVCMLGMAPNPQRGGLPTKALFIIRVE